VTPAAATMDLWESLVAASPPARGAVVLLACGAARDLDAAGDLSLAVAAREALGELRARVGPELDAVLSCPGCAAMLDVPLPLDEIMAASDVVPDGARVDGVVLRGPTTADLLAALASADPAATLRARCVTWPEGTRPDSDVALTARVAAAAACGGVVVADVDVVGLLTERVAEEARAVLSDVAVLAAAFGWSEQEVLALSPSRVDAYLGLVRAPR
jgi:hypothetical protein